MIDRRESFLETVRHAATGRYPLRYQHEWVAAFHALIRRHLAPGVRILDVGSGRRPSIAPDRRPAGARYVGLDISAAELRCAPPDAYDEWAVADIVTPVPAFREQFDLIVSYQVLEHVKPLDAAFDNMRTYLRPGGVAVTQFSGAFSAFGVINRLIPAAAGVWAMKHLLSRNPETVFPAHYDQCYASAIRGILDPWSERRIYARYGGAVYWRFNHLLQAAYTGYEEWCYRTRRPNLATHYLVEAVK